MSFAGFKKQLNKANQYMNEKIGGAKGTELDESFIEMEKKVDVLCKMIDDLLGKTQEMLQPNPASRAKMSAAKSISKLKGGGSGSGGQPLLYPQPEGILGECMIKYGKDLGDSSLYGQALLEAGDTYKQMADIKYTLEDNVKHNFIEPMLLFQSKDLKEVMHHRKKMSSRRLDYDGKKRREKGPGIEEEIRNAEEKFEESRALAETAMQNLLDNEADQVVQLTAFIDAELQYHRQTADMLETLKRNLEKKCEGFSNGSTNHRATKKTSSMKSSGSSDTGSIGFNNLSVSNNYPSNAAAVSHLDPVGWGSVSHTAEPSGWTPYCEALYDFIPESASELGFKAGDRIELKTRVDENWLEGTLRGKTGYFPTNYVNVIVDLPY